MTEDRVCRGDNYIMDIKVDVNASVWRLLVWGTRTLLLVPQLSTVKMKSIRLLSVSTGRHLLSRRDVLAGSSGGRTIAVLVTTLTTPLGSHTAGKTEESGICWWHKKYLALDTLFSDLTGVVTLIQKCSHTYLWVHGFWKGIAELLSRLRSMSWNPLKLLQKSQRSAWDWCPGAPGLNQINRMRNV